MQILAKVLRRLSMTASNMLAFEHFQFMRAARRTMLGLSGVQVANEDLFIDSGLRVLNPINLEIQGRVSLGHDNHFWCFSRIVIGARTQTAKDLLAIAGSHDVADFSAVAGPGQEIVIGAGCWIGARVTLLGGTKLGPGCVVGAGAVVKGSFPAWSVVAGVPARIIRKRVPSDRIASPFGYYRPEDVDPNYLRQGA